MKLMTVDELAGYLRVTPRTVYRWLEAGDIPVRKVGRQWRFDRGLVDAWSRERPAEKASRIIVIDDDEAVLSLFKDTLETSGHSVDVSSSSVEGLEMIKAQDYDLAFIDLKMPVMDGAELFGQIKLRKPKLPVTVITGYPDSEIMAKALKHGPLGVITKPFTASRIQAAVDSFLHVAKKA